MVPLMNANELWRSVSQCRSLDSELLHPELERAAVDAEALRGAVRTGQRPPRRFQRYQDVRALGVLERPRRSTRLRRADPLIDLRHRDLQPFARRSDDGS